MHKDPVPQCKTDLSRKPYQKKKMLLQKGPLPTFPPTRKETSPKLQHRTFDPSSLKPSRAFIYVGDDNPMMMSMQNNDDVTMIR